MMKRALVPCAVFAILGATGCASDANPTPPPTVSPLDGGLGERAATQPPDTRPPAIEAGGRDTVLAREDALDAPLPADAAAGIDVAPPALVTVTIVSPAAGGAVDGGTALPAPDGGPGLPVFARTARLAPQVRVAVESRGGDPTADVIVAVAATLTPENATTAAAKVTLNQTQYQMDPASDTKIYWYGDTPFDLTKLATGAYRLVVTATTAGGATASATTSIWVDAGPVITFLTPADGVFVKGSVVVTVVIVDDRAGVGAVDFSVGQVQIAPSAISSNGAQHTVTLDFGSFNPPLDGPQVVTVAATNGNGVVSLATRRFTVDSEGPSITGTEPATGKLIGKLITVEASVSDPAGVMENSVVAVVAHGDVRFEVHLESVGGGKYQQLFDTTQLPEYTLFPSISFRAQDMLGNQASVGYLVSLDNTPPVMDLDPPANVRLLKEDGTCSWPFDPVGPDAIDDGTVVNQLFDIRARIEDDGNMPATGVPDFIPISGVDPKTVKVLILDDTSLPLVVDTSDPPDGICDDTNPELEPSVSPQSSRDAQLVDLVTLAPGGSGDFSYQPGVACTGDENPPKALCATTFSSEKGRAMTYSMQYAAGPSIWTIPPVVGDGLQCAGRQFDASNNLSDGWACLAVVAADGLGNKQVSRPIRICVAAQPESTACTAAASGGADLAAVSLPSSTAGSVVITTKTPLLGLGDAPVVDGDVLVVSEPSPSLISIIGGDHVVAPQGSSATQFALSDLNLAPQELWLDPLDGTPPSFKGSVGLLLQDGVDVQVITDQPNTPLDASYVGAVVLLGRGQRLTEGSKRWRVANIQPTGFTLADSAVEIAGFVTAGAKLPNCTGTVIKGAAGVAPRVDGTVPCSPWRSFPEYEYIRL
jgi:hypothetical protein